MYFLKRINKCVYTGEKYNILYNVEEGFDKSFLIKNREVDSLFDEDDFLKQRKIISFCNIHKRTSLVQTIDGQQILINDCFYFPSSVYVRKDMRGKKLGNDLYVHMLSAIKMIHGKSKIKFPVFLQHEKAEEWAKTAPKSKKIYNFLLKNNYVSEFDILDKHYENVHGDIDVLAEMANITKSGWYLLDLNNIHFNGIRYIKKD